jgi:hypothetical protein
MCVYNSQKEQIANFVKILLTAHVAKAYFVSIL